ncbi:unnamed protein product [Pleuronectes platessa]|uniref:Uncharacterized protein n=1 Tax=Pleuronectes platessa TaxID=8262 RepID=A0A9N7TR01_PLEPL|nr:unnamed protein product [Pleuronectes platessa]
MSLFFNYLRPRVGGYRTALAALWEVVLRSAVVLVLTADVNCILTLSYTCQRYAADWKEELAGHCPVSILLPHSAALADHKYTPVRQLITQEKELDDLPPHQNTTECLIIVTMEHSL